MNNDLISRSALLEELKERYNEAKERENANYEWETFESDGIESAMLCVENFPAVDAKPVRHGKWLFSDYDYFTCSVCGGQYFTGADSTKDAKAMLENNAYYPYCPYCGASMKGEKNHE